MALAKRQLGFIGGCRLGGAVREVLGKLVTVHLKAELKQMSCRNAALVGNELEDPKNVAHCKQIESLFADEKFAVCASGSLVRNTGSGNHL